MNVRFLALVLPICLLVLLLLVREEKDEHVVIEEEPSVVVAEVLPTEPGIVWISHDWVEIAPRSHLREADKAELRRQTFGLDLINEDAQCIDPNCRACLIDFVYGREF